MLTELLLWDCILTGVSVGILLGLALRIYDRFSLGHDV